MKSLGHGANVDEMATRYQKETSDIIDFSSNINPYVSKKLEEHLNGALAACISYPDIHYTALKQHIATYLGCEMSQVIPGNGATEIMYLLMKSIKGTLGILNPTFSEYERSARLNGLEVIDLHLDEEKGFKIDQEELENKLSLLDALFVCNPNNPTGNVQELVDILQRLAKTGKLLIVDETFMEFVEGEDRYSLVPYIKDYPNLIIIKAITKFFGLPGLRLGYGISSNQELLEGMYYYKEPWTVNGFAEVLTKHLLCDADYIEESKDYFIEERAYMLKQLREISGLEVYHTNTNFILLRLQDNLSHELKDKSFIKYNLLVRDASNFKGLDEQFIRVAVKKREENNQLIEALQAELAPAFS